MAEKPVAFDRTTGERILAAVRRVEQMPASALGDINRTSGPRNYVPIQVINQAAEPIPKYSIVESTSVGWILDAQTGLYIARHYVRQYNGGLMPRCLFIGARSVEPDGIGQAQSGPYFICSYERNGTQEIGGYAGPKNGSYLLHSYDTDATPYRIVGKRQQPDVLLVEQRFGDTVVIQGPAGGIGGRSGSAIPSQNCYVLRLNSLSNLEATGETIKVYNFVTQTILDKGERIGLASLSQDGRWWAIADDCKDGEEAQGGTAIPPT